MLTRDIDRIFKSGLTEFLVPVGFSSAGSRYATFHRTLPSGIVHVVMPDPGRGGRQLDVKVFATAPCIDPNFSARFPDSLGIPFDTYCFLNRTTGIGSEKQTFKCETAEELATSIEQKIAPLLLTLALPILDRIDSVAELLPYLRRPPFFSGFAHHQLGNASEARKILGAERQRLEPSLASDNSGVIKRILERIDEILG